MTAFIQFPLTPSPSSCNHKPDLFFYEFVCFCLFLKYNLPTVNTMLVPVTQHSDLIFLYISRWSPWWLQSLSVTIQRYCIVTFFFLISHQFYTHQCIHVNPNHPIQHTTIPTPPRFSPLGVHTFVLYICVSTSALHTGSSVPFF